MTDATGILSPTSSSGINSLQWGQVEGFFRIHGCVIVGAPELLWYRESWGAMEKAGLINAAEFKNSELNHTMSKLRTVCLLAMYLGIYQAAGEFSELGGYFLEHPHCSSYLDSLNVDINDIWTFTRHVGWLETDTENYWEDEETDDDLLYELAAELITDETSAIFSALLKHYGNETKLFVSLWESRMLADEAEPLENILNSGYFGDGKLEVWTYVDEGMSGWRWI